MCYSGWYFEEGYTPPCAQTHTASEDKDFFFLPARQGFSPDCYFPFSNVHYCIIYLLLSTLVCVAGAKWVVTSITPIWVTSACDY